MENNIAFSTSQFRMSASNFMMSFIFRFAWIWLLLLSGLGIAGLVVGITVDLRWFIIGLMLIFIILPMIMAFLYFSYGLKKECYINTVPHNIDFGEMGVNVNLTFPSYSEEEEEKQKERTEFFEYGSMRPFRVGAKSVTIPFKSPRKGFLWIPADAFENEDHLENFLQFIDLKIAKG